MPSVGNLAGSTEMIRLLADPKDEKERRQSARILSGELARLRGWLCAVTPFSLEQLNRRSNKIRRGEDTALNRETVFYREKRSRRPSAIAVHLSGWPEVGPEIEDVCERFGLRYEAVADFPAWVDGCQLVVLTPGAGSTSQKRRRRRKGSWPNRHTENRSR